VVKNRQSVTNCFNPWCPLVPTLVIDYSHSKAGLTPMNKGSTRPEPFAKCVESIARRCEQTPSPKGGPIGHIGSVSATRLTRHPNGHLPVQADRRGS